MTTVDVTRTVPGTEPVHDGDDVPAPGQLVTVRNRRWVAATWYARGRQR